MVSIRRFSPNSLAALLTSVLLCGALAACGGSDGASTETDSGGSSETGAPEVADDEASIDEVGEGGSGDEAGGEAPPEETGADEMSESDTDTDTDTESDTDTENESEDDIGIPTGAEFELRADHPRTVDELLALERPLNIAHAGGDREWPHSTPFAFTRAAQAGADVLELDVLQTSDGVVVVQHDDTVDKTTETTGPVSELTLAELQALDNAYWFSPECWPCQDRDLSEYIHRGVRTGEIEPPEGFEPDDFAVPTLAQISERFPDHVLDIEMKGSLDATPELVPALAAEIDALGRTDSVIVVSFDDAMTAEFKRLAPEVATSPGLGEMTQWFLADAPLGDHVSVQVPPEFEGVEVVTAESVAKAQADGLEVWVWPNTDEQERTEFYSQMLDLGVDGILAARPTEMAPLAR